MTFCEGDLRVRVATAVDHPSLPDVPSSLLGTRDVGFCRLVRVNTVSVDLIAKLDDLTQRTAPRSHAADSLQVGYPLLDVLAQPAHGSSVRTADF